MVGAAVAAAVLGLSTTEGDDGRTTAEAQTPQPSATPTLPPDELRPIVRSRAEPWVTCSGREVFRPSALRRPPTAQRARSGAAAALREFIRNPDGAEPVPPDRWRLLVQRKESAAFGRGPRHQLTVVNVELRSAGWDWAGSTYGCSVSAVRGGERASGVRLDPSAPPRPGDSRIRFLVTESDCASGESAHGRVQRPDLFLDDERAVLRFFVTPQTGSRRCPSNPPTPVVVTLPESLGERTLYNGGPLTPRKLRG